jgi:hypothetical protein
MSYATRGTARGDRRYGEWRLAADAEPGARKDLTEAAQ